MNKMMAWVRSMRGYALPTGLGVLNLVLIGFWFAVFTPMLDSNDLEMRKLRAHNISLRNQIDENTLALESIDENRERYAGLSKRGFLIPQDRLGATKFLDRLRKVHGLTSIYYQVSPETLYDDRATQATGFNIVTTRIVVTMRGLFDADILEFTQAVIDEFPGQVRPLNFSLSKLSAPTEKTLSLLREGKLVDFISGELTFEWNTLRPVEKKNSG